MTTSIKDAEEKLGQDKIEEIVEKDWKTADLPTEEELASEPVTHPKARNNPNSRANLFQYQKKKSKAAKEKVVKNLKFKDSEPDANARDFFDPEVDDKLIRRFTPAIDFLSGITEQEYYYSTINQSLKDFDLKELSSSDLDDIITLAINRVLVYRLLKATKDSPKLLIDVTPSIEKFQKHSEKIKEGLAARRVDRIDVRNKPSFSIVDLAIKLDDQKRKEFDDRITQMKAEEKEFLAQKKLREDD